MSSNRAVTIIALMGALALAAPAACGGSTPTLPSGLTGGDGGDDSSGIGVGPGVGTTGVGGASSTTSTGTAGGCMTAADCDDALPCTDDTCSVGACQHTAKMCAQAEVCDAVKGCVPAMACSTTAQCMAALGADACKADILCDPAQSICTYKTLDKDMDGYPPSVCGGTDCDDSNPTVHPGASEVCDGKDNDCNGKIDDGATCGGMMACQAGACVCPPADLCNGQCVDLTSDEQHCGSCGNACPQAATCVNSACVCAANATVCNGQCVDLKSDPFNCNVCGKQCGANFGCQGGACTCSKTLCNGSCLDTTSDNLNCGACNKQCPFNSTCQNSTCECAGSLELCNGVCTDTQSDPKNCSFCGQACPGNESCVNGACQNALFTFSGVKTNVPIASLSGWTQCWLDNYSSTSSLATIMASCVQANMLIGCRPSGSSTLTLAAEAPRADVMFETGAGNVTHDVNGVSWYFDTNTSWGFAPQGDAVVRNTCDVVASSLMAGGVDGGLRMCWHTSASNMTPGWRCGATDSIFGATYDRLVFQAP